MHCLVIRFGQTRRLHYVSKVKLVHACNICFRHRSALFTCWRTQVFLLFRSFSAEEQNTSLQLTRDTHCVLELLQRTDSRVAPRHAHTAASSARAPQLHASVPITSTGAKRKERGEERGNHGGSLS